MEQPNLTNITNAFQVLANEVPNVQNLPVVATATQFQNLTAQIQNLATQLTRHTAQLQALTTQIQSLTRQQQDLTTQHQALTQSIDQRMYNILDFSIKCL